MDLRQLRYFIAVAEELSFTRAARRLNISQPPLSQQIQALETALSTVLLRRTSRRVEMTEAGEALLAHARSLVYQFARAQEEVRAIGAGSIGTIDIGATGSILRGRLADLLAAYRMGAPAVRTVLHEQPPVLQIKSLLNRTTSISFIRGSPTEAELTSEIAWREEIVVALPTSHRLAGRKRIALRELDSDEHIILRPESSQFARYIQQCCVDAGFLPRVSQQVVDAQSIPALVVAGFGIALVPHSISRFPAGDIVFRPIRPAPPAADVYMVYQRDQQSAIVRTFVKVARHFLQTPAMRP